MRMNAQIIDQQIRGIANKLKSELEDACDAQLSHEPLHQDRAGLATRRCA
jgi:hypothetical protein